MRCLKWILLSLLVLSSWSVLAADLENYQPTISSITLANPELPAIFFDQIQTPNANSEYQEFRSVFSDLRTSLQRLSLDQSRGSLLSSISVIESTLSGPDMGTMGLNLILHSIDGSFHDVDNWSQRIPELSKKADNLIRENHSNISQSKSSFQNTGDVFKQTTAVFEHCQHQVELAARKIDKAIIATAGVYQLSKPLLGAWSRVGLAGKSLSVSANASAKDFVQTENQLLRFSQEWKNSVDDFSKKLHSSDNQIGNLNRILADKKKQVDQKIQERKEINTKLDNQKRELNQLKAKISRTNKNELQSLDMELLRLKGQMDQANGQLSLVDMALRNLQTEIANSASGLSSEFRSRNAILDQFNNEGTKKSHNFAMLQTTLGNTARSMPWYKKSVEDFCASSNNFTQELVASGIDQGLEFEQRIDQEIAAEQITDNTRLDHGFTISLSDNEINGKLLRHVVDRQIIFENRYSISAQGFNPFALEGSRDLVFGYENALSNNLLSLGESYQSAQFIAGIQNVAAGIASLGLGFVPVVGQAKDFLDAMTGRDLLTGQEFGGGERIILAVGAMLPLAGHAAGKLLSTTIRLVDKPWTKLFRTAEVALPDLTAIINKFSGTENGVAEKIENFIESGKSGLLKMGEVSIPTSKNLKDAEGLFESPILKTEYTAKVQEQMANASDLYHSFPRSVDAFSAIGNKTIIRGGDGIERIKIELVGSYRGVDGHFEWLIEPDQTVNHRMFIPKEE